MLWWFYMDHLVACHLFVEDLNTFLELHFMYTSIERLIQITARTDVAALLALSFVIILFIENRNGS